MGSTIGSKIEAIFSGISMVSDPLPLSLTLLALALAFALVITPTIWTYSRNFITVAHEGGHAIVALLCGRRLNAIKLHTDTSGLTVSSGKPHGLGMILTLCAGYTAPAVIATGLAYLVSKGYIFLGIVSLGLMLAAMFLMIRNLWGFIVVAPLVIVFYFLTQLTWTEGQNLALTFVVWFLAVGAFRPIIELLQHNRRPGYEDSDASQLQRLTKLIPAEVWILFFLIVAAACGFTTFDLLVGVR